MQARMTSDLDLSIVNAEWPIHLAISSETLNVTDMSAVMISPMFPHTPCCVLSGFVTGLSFNQPLTSLGL